MTKLLENASGACMASAAPARPDYELTDFGVIQAISRGGPNGNLSMAMHVYGLGAWNFR